MNHATPIQPERSTAELLNQISQLRDQAEQQHLTLPNAPEEADSETWGAPAAS